MKKAILIILAILPIVLLMVIAIAGNLAGEILENYAVERVVLTNRFGNEIPDGDSFTLERGKEKSIYSMVLPKTANEQRVEYSSSDTSIFTVDNKAVEYGVAATGNAGIILNRATIKAVGEGTATLTVRSMESNKIVDTIKVVVTADVPYKVDLGIKELTVKIGEQYKFNTRVYSHAAIISTVTYSSSNPSVVTVNSAGVITAKSEGTATITVTTDSGGLTDSCVVNVVEGKPDIYFEFPDTEFKLTDPTSKIYQTILNQIDLYKYVRFNGEIIDQNDIKLILTQGGGAAVLDENGVLAINKQGTYIGIKAYVGDEKNPDYYVEIKIKLTDQLPA